MQTRIISPTGYSETAAASIFADTNVSTRILAFNHNGQFADGRGSLAWSYWNGTAWSTVRESVTAWTTPALTGGAGFVEFQGDPAVVGTGRAKEAVFFQIAAGILGSQATGDIVMAASSTAGSTVMTTTNTISGHDANVQSGGIGGVDLPRAATDYTNSTVWVLWRGGGHGWITSLNFSGFPLGSYRQGPTIDLNAKIGFNLDETHGYDIAVKPAATVGGTPKIYIVWPTYSGLSLCNTTSVNDIISVTWKIAVSTDGGNTFVTRDIWTDPAWRKCIGPNRPGINRTVIEARYDAVSGYLMTVNSQSAYDVLNRTVGMRVVLRQSNDDFVSADSWTPSCAPGDAHLYNGNFPTSEPFCLQFAPAVGVTQLDATTSRAAFTWHSIVDSTATCTDGTAQVDVWGASVRPGSPYDFEPATQSRITALGGGVPWCQSPSSGNTAWGDYEQLAGSAPGVYSSTFHLGYADHASTDVRVANAFFSP